MSKQNSEPQVVTPSEPTLRPPEKPSFAWQDALGVAGVLSGLATLLELPNGTRVLLLSLSALCLAGSILGHTRWPWWARIGLSALAVVLFGGSAYYVAVSRPERYPTLTEIAKLLREQPQQQTVGPAPVVAPVPPKYDPPYLTLEPATSIAVDATGSFALNLINRGCDVEDVGWTIEPFVARKVDGKLTMLILSVWNEQPRPDAAPLRTNQNISMPFQFTPYDLSIYQKTAEKYPSLLGVRFTFSFLRYADQKPFKRRMLYGFESSPQGQVLYAPGTMLDELRIHPPISRDKIVSLSEVNALVDVDERWKPIEFRIDSNGSASPLN